MKQKVTFVADIGGDIDDIIAIDFLHRAGRLDYVVLDGYSRDKQREELLISKGIKIQDKISCCSRFIFCGGAFTKIAEFLECHQVNLLVANGFFAGSNIVPSEHVLEKFRGQEWCRSYNPGLDMNSAFDSICSPNLLESLIVSKNVCHHEENVFGGWHKDPWLQSYNLKKGKKLHDLLMIKEGLKHLDDEEKEIEYDYVTIEAEPRDGNIKFRAVKPDPCRGSTILMSIFKKS